MKHFSLIVLIFLFFSSQLFADEFRVKSFKKIDNKVLTNNAKVYDDNDELCSIVFIRTSLIDLGISASTPIVGNVKWIEGDYRVNLSAGTRMVKFFKNGFETIEYFFPQKLEKGNFYLLELEYRRTDAIVIGNTMGFVIIESKPTGSSVWINGEETGQYTPFSRILSEGFYRFTLKKELYKNYVSDFTIKPKQNTDLSVGLKPDYGKLLVITRPESSAEIIIDNKNTDKQSPAEIDFLSVGNHQLSLKKEMYETYDSSFNISAGQTNTIIADLVPTFGTIEITANEGGEILIDLQKMGSGKYKGSLIKGQHLLEVQKQGYYSESMTIDIIAGQNISKEISLKVKTGVLSINSDPLRAEIFLEGEHMGQTPIFINNLMVGTYYLKLQKQGFATLEKQIEITENQTTSINESLINAVEEQININSPDDKPYVDDQKKVITPSTISLKIENHYINHQKEEYPDLKTSKIETTAPNHLNFDKEALSPPTILSEVADIEFVFVEGGTFQMGSNIGDGDEKPVHSVTLSDFYIGKYEITKKQWKSVMGNHPSYFKGCDNCPVESVSWNDIQEFIYKLNKKTGMNYRLPSEAEWEYAARGGNQSRDYKYSGGNVINKVAWYIYNSRNITDPVGTKKANELEIFDMSGNVWEWCNDWYEAEFYKKSPQNNPQGPLLGSYPVIRGGSWRSKAQNCRSTHRNYNHATYRFNYLGFRLAHSSPR